MATSEEAITGSCGAEQPKKLSQEKKHHLQGGYECIFVKAPPEVLQTECPVCLCVLREPYLLDCCGNSFCKTCIEPIKSEKKPCPLCNVQFTTSIPDKRLQRTLNELQVYCCHTEAGCEWVGELGSLPQHLNLKPQDEGHRFSGCQLVSISCTFCTLDIQRKYLKEHEEAKCPQRPFSCEYCQDYHSIYEDVTTNHWPVCPSRPIPCPNECGASLEIRFLDHHVESECPLQIVDCAFKYAGCNERPPRKDIPDHISQSMALHMSLQAASHQQQLTKLSSRVSELEEHLQEATVKIGQLEAEISVLHKKLEQERKPKLEDLLGNMRAEIEKSQNLTKLEISKKMQEMETEIAAVHKAIHNHVGLVPFSFTMPEFEEKKSSNTSWFCPPFYTHPHGYKMCLEVCPNGYDEGVNTHVSVYLYTMRGEYDESLKWPFQGDVTIQLLSQVGGSEHYEKVLDITENDNVGRIADKERSQEGWGFDLFIRHEDLQPRYLKDNCLKLHVC